MSNLQFLVGDYCLFNNSNTAVFVSVFSSQMNYVGLYENQENISPRQSSLKESE